NELRILLQDNLNIEFISATLSNPRQKEGTVRVKVRPVLKKDKLFFQRESFRNNQTFHQNVGPEETIELIMEYMENMKQMQMETKQASFSVLISKKGKVTIKKRKNQCERKEIDMSHNRKKRYVLEEGVPVPFLKDLGVMTEEGKVVQSKFDKFRQINRFLEFIEDILPQLDKERELTILDFGCGKSYLTFAMYYYLHELKKYDIRIIGLDLKTDVIRHCNELSQKYGYEKLKFLEGNIADYTGVDAVDMVVTLHACDTATDYALAKAVGWNAKVILSVPCCQHELNRQMENEVLAPIFRYGLLKERMAALVTDGLRAQYLEREGYDTQILEFIDMEHTPKNILIRAVRTGKNGENEAAIRRCEECLHVSPTLGRLLDHEEGE
ncbi:class I SAM-dependent methyltransferase, partial [Faecalicatena contorta]|uniref:class I SAM-dependent methyltransferase n=1 Tax=Faecalicatena contorta TaxID=39482 RepID=UPI001F221A72